MDNGALRSLTKGPVSLWLAVRLAARVIPRRPLFSILVVGTATIGFGAFSVVFSAVDHALLRPLPFPNSERVVRLFEVDAAEPSRSLGVSYEHFLRWQKSRTLVGVAAYEPGSELVVGAPAERLRRASVSSAFFQVMGVRPLLGRGFDARDESVGATSVTIISEGLWRRRFGASASVIGSTLRTSTGTREIVGVARNDNPLLDSVQLWIPLRPPDSAEVRGLWVVGELRDGVAGEQVATELRRLADSDLQPWSVRIVPLKRDVVGSLRRPLLVGLMSVGVVLIVALINIVGLMTAAATDRRKEIFVCYAIGATGPSVAAQLAAEGALLVGGGAIAGLCSATLGMGLLRGTIQFAGPLMQSFDCRVIGIVCSAAFVAGSVAGVLAAAQCGLLRSVPGHVDRQPLDRTRRVGAIVVACEISLAILVAAWAGLLARSVALVNAVDAGFDVDHTMMLQVSSTTLGSQGLPSTFADEIIESTRRIPEVLSVAATDTPPFGGVSMHGVIVTGGGRRSPVIIHAVTPEYFATMGIPILEGREFSREDSVSTQPCVVLSQALAARLWTKTEDRVGRYLRIVTGRPARPRAHLIVGVAADVHQRSLEGEVRDEVYVPLTERPPASLAVVVRSKVIGQTFGLIQRTFGATDRFVVDRLVTFRDLVDETTADRRSRAMLIWVASGATFLMAVVGVAGVAMYSAARREHEAAIRLALGASGKDLVTTILSPVVTGIAVGVCAGVTLANTVSGALAPLLFGITIHDPVAMVCAVLAVCSTSVSAAWIPAKRLRTVNPATILRMT